jgi:hypothetical protein
MKDPRVKFKMRCPAISGSCLYHVCDACKAELAELRLDKKRLDWIGTLIEFEVQESGIFEIWIGDGQWHGAPTLREAIDKARESQ